MSDRQSLTPAESAVLKYVSEVNAADALLIVRLQVSRRVYMTISESALEHIREREKKTADKYLAQLDIAQSEKEVLAKKLVEGNALRLMIERDSNEYLKRNLYEPTVLDINPLERKCRAITYDQIERDMSISRDVAKRALGLLEKRGIIYKKRVRGGLSYVQPRKCVVDQMKQNPGDFYAVSCCGIESACCKDELLQELMENSNELENARCYYQKAVDEL